MTLQKNALLITLTFLLSHLSYCQYTDSSKIGATDKAYDWKTMQNTGKNNNLKARQFYIPGIMVAYGFIALGNHELKDLNAEIKDEVYAESPHKKISVDNYLQYGPAFTVYALNLAGVKGKNNFRDRSEIYLMSNIILSAIVLPLKKITNIQRPDQSDFRSFPSGHTTTAFASAEFMWQEYRETSIWYGVAGYAMAATTGYLRMYNNKHWLNDVVAGAGIGIASTKIAYWLYPKVQHLLFKNKPLNTMIMPMYDNKFAGIALVRSF